MSAPQGPLQHPRPVSPTPASKYYSKKGVNPQAVTAFVPSAVIALGLALVPAFGKVAPFGWFIGAGLGAVAYYIVTRGWALDEPPTGETVVRAQQPVD